ncbi:hypothetical protein HanRHA438_Chr14g0665871 [Helianthus annuus]|uniref:Uncharacterized protein n=1 Tax=Helianthus annuus TaxID=4232 RepID=A0A9K3EBD8_HELAN|nr:hypothetical protein HanXRQr2_Chr14g0655051 [Helianthus annuus]KAJ0854736.1 hypothetical protein HanRHA438_Chr14g0665871 [Helianthus annuus]
MEKLIGSSFTNSFKSTEKRSNKAIKNATSNANQNSKNRPNSERWCNQYKQQQFRHYPELFSTAVQSKTTSI